MEERKPKNMIVDLRRFNSAFITNIKSKASGVEKRCICIPIEENFVVEGGYSDRAGNPVRTAEVQVKMWPVTEEAKQDYGKKHDWELRLDISQKANEMMQTKNPELLSKLMHKDAMYDKELSKKLLPYLGRCFEFKQTVLPKEEAVRVDDVEDDLPF